MIPEPLGIGVIGTGIMGRRMIAALKPHPRFRIVALWDPDAAALRDACALAPGARAADGMDDLVDDPAIRVVYVASPPATHRRGVEAIVRAGRAGLCEKPLAADLDEAAAIRDVVAGRPFAVNFPFATSDAATGLVSLVREGRLGALQRASIHVRFAQWPRPWQAGASSWLAGPSEGGFTREVLSHFVFLAQRLFGPARVADIDLVREANRAETALRARLVCRELDVTIDAAVAGDIADQNRFEIVGADGTASLGEWSRLTWAGRTTERVDNTSKTLDGLAAMLDGRTGHGLATVDEAVDVVRVIETMLA